MKNLMYKLGEHVRKHEDCAIEICPMAITKTELQELLDGMFLFFPMYQGSIEKIKKMDSGYVGKIYGVDCFLLEDEEKA